MRPNWSPPGSYRPQNLAIWGILLHEQLTRTPLGTVQYYIRHLIARSRKNRSYEIESLNHFIYNIALQFDRRLASSGAKTPVYIARILREHYLKTIVVVALAVYVTISVLRNVTKCKYRYFPSARQRLIAAKLFLPGVSCLDVITGLCLSIYTTFWSYLLQKRGKNSTLKRDWKWYQR